MNRLLCATNVIVCSLLVVACAGSPKPSEPPPPPLAENRIPAIQAKAHRSPLIDKRIEGIEGVVTAVLSGGRAPGFWMQDPRGDDDEETSDAIFVSTEGIEVEVAVGDAVTVSGRVAETGREGSLATTQIVEASVTVSGSDRPLPEPVRIGLKGRLVPTRIATEGMKEYQPKSVAIDFWESLEGMRIELRDPVVVGPTSRYGDMVVLADRGAGAKIRSLRGGVVLQEHAPNPERIVLDARVAGRFPSASIGDRFDGVVTGVVDYAFNHYRFVVTSELPALVAEAQPPEVTRLEGTADRLTIATYNVLNLSAKNPAKRFEDVARTIAVNLGAPDVIGLQEMQDDSGPEDDGVVTATETFRKLIEAIVAAGGPRYEFRQIDPANNEDGGQPGGNIRVGFLVNPARVTFVDRGSAGAKDATAVETSEGGARLTLSPGRIDPANPCFAGGGEGDLAEPTRKSLAAELQFGDQTFFVVVNHLKSKRGDGGLFGAMQPPARPTEEQRLCQAEVVGRFAAEILKADPKAAVVVLGDMNEHEFRPPMRKMIEVSGLTNLHDRVVVADRYTYVWEGNSQVLDHILVSPSLLDGAEIDIVHVNAEYPEEKAASDHDPIVARVKM